tara:strand:+ start:8711 stop:9799 length:1089 start_codon:yes stop_codon:yes gene_type:complete
MDFMGKMGFQWFVGVVEDRNDPQKVGRVRVRCLGYHTPDKGKLPTADLPWAHVMNPITSATVSGVGQTPLGMVEGTWCVGFFVDGEDAQQPHIIGTLPGVPTQLPAGLGFEDPNSNYPKYKETDVNRLAVGDENNPHKTITLRKADRTTNIGNADFYATDMPLIDSDGASAQQNLAEDDGTEFSEPEIPYGAKYPHNHVYESEAGHIKEYDDTPNKERIHERHSTGTGYEIDEFGTKVQRVKKDNYQLISGDHFELIKGTSNVTINKGSRLFVNAAAGENQHFTIQIGENGNLNLQVDAGKINIHNVQGDINMKAGGSINLEAGAHIRMKATDYATTVSGDMNEEVQGKNRKTGKPIDLNPA